VGVGVASLAGKGAATLRKIFFLVLILVNLAQTGRAQDEREFRLQVDAELEASGLMAYLLPRFALKTGRRAELVPSKADLMINPAGNEGHAIMARGDRTFALVMVTTNPAALKFADWLASDIGQTAIAAFTPADGLSFSGAPQETAVVTITFEGDPQLGEALAENHCGRCHRVRADRSGMGIGSTPSFRALRALADWDERFLAFYALNPHPAFLRVEDISPPFDPAFPPAIHPVELTQTEVEAIQAYAAGLEPADLGAPVSNN
jgi:mono/diheme cytochrome c family protein